MPLTIVAGKLAEKYKTRLRDLEKRLFVIEAMLVLPVLVAAIRWVHYKFIHRQVELNVGKEVPETMKLFPDLKDVAERAFATFAEVFLATAAVQLDIPGLRAAALAGAAAGLSVLKNYFKQWRELRSVEDSEEA